MWPMALAIAALQPANSPTPPADAPTVASAAPVEPAPVAAPTVLKLPALTVVRLSIDQDLVSKTATIGQEFDLRLAAPIDMGQGLVIPAGTKGRGWVVFASKAKLGGKAGELLLGARYLEIGGVKIPLRSLKLWAPQGKDNSGLAMGVTAVAGPVGALISGGQARVASGHEAIAKIAADTDIPIALLSVAPTLQGTPIVATPAPTPAVVASPSTETATEEFRGN